MTLVEIAAVAAALLSAITLWRQTKDKRFNEIKYRFDKIDEKFDNIDEKFNKVEENFRELRTEIKEIHYDMSDMRERLAAIEMSTIFLQVNPTPPSRSEVAKKMWERRKAKQLESKE